jgi:cell division protein FtsB
MKQVLNKEEVAQAIAELGAKGKKPTLTMLHAALGNRGSLTTLVKLKAEIEAGTGQAPESSEALEAFRKVWRAALEEGQAHQEALVTEARETIKVVCAENERLDARVAAAEASVAQLKDAKSHAELELGRVRGEAADELSRTKTALSDALQKLTAAQTAHAAEVSRLRSDLDAALMKAHNAELDLARAQARAQAFLEARGQTKEECP